MKRLFFFLLSSCSFFCFGQNVGINIAAPEASLDVNGDLILRSADLTLTDGDNIINVTNNPFSNYRITGPTATFNVTGLTYGPDGKLVTIFNRSGFTMVLINESPATIGHTQRIITGTGADLNIPNNASANFQFDGGAQRWVLRSHSGILTGSGSGVSWSLNGNAGTNASTDFIGTTDNTAFVIKSNNQTVALFQFGSPSNNYIGTNFQRTGVGILGTGAPSHTLEVGLADLAGGSTGVLGIRGTVNNTHFNYGVNEDVYIRGGKNGSHILLNDILGTGNVGIGTPYMPSRKLELYRGRMLFAGAQDAANGIHPGIEFTNDDNTALRGFLGMASDNLIGMYGYAGAGFGLVMNVANGNIGIGTTNPTNKLSVNGDIRSREVTVETANWPDYVFEQEYKLRPLAEVENFIIQHKHLPEIPSANDMHSNGLKLGDLQKKMMEKIEELTLYIIAQQKQIDQLLKINTNKN
jgi:hypothetical protein